MRVYNLLDTSVYLSLSHNPGGIEQEINTGKRWVVIDEVQRLPHLMKEVHRLMEARGIYFLLPGSSARKLRRGGVNLLGDGLERNICTPSPGGNWENDLICGEP